MWFHFNRVLNNYALLQSLKKISENIFEKCVFVNHFNSYKKKIPYNEKKLNNIFGTLYNICCQTISWENSCPKYKLYITKINNRKYLRLKFGLLFERTLFCLKNISHFSKGEILINQIKIISNLTIAWKHWQYYWLYVWSKLLDDFISYITSLSRNHLFY
jgi:hypothetical protein